jgi:hypothetical protein
LRKSPAHPDHPDQYPIHAIPCYTFNSTARTTLDPPRTTFQPLTCKAHNTMMPKAPHYRNNETLSRLDRLDQRDYDAALLRKLRRETQLKNPPSQHVQAWRDYERTYFYARGYQPPPCRMGYHLWTDATALMQCAYSMVTDDLFAKRTGRTKATRYRWALATVAEAIGYRYLRGLEVIEGELARGRHLAKFRHERMEFRHAFELSVDAAHTINDKGQSPGAALEVVLLFQSELLALCPWLELVGNTLEAGLLREACQLPKIPGI